MIEHTKLKSKKLPITKGTKHFIDFLADF